MPKYKFAGTITNIPNTGGGYLGIGTVGVEIQFVILPKNKINSFWFLLDIKEVGAQGYWQW